MDTVSVVAAVEREFATRKFSAGVFVALIDLLGNLGVYENKSISSYADLVQAFERVETGPRGKANTLIVRTGRDTTLSLRRFYDQVEQYFRNEMKRFDFPTCAPHATQSWKDYIPWIDKLCTANASEASRMRGAIVEFVLSTLPSHAFDPSKVVREPPLFELLLSDFDLTSQRGETTGAAYQGIVFGFVRADNPHLQVEIDKVRTGSKRLQRVGDIDAREGSRLALTAEVKQYTIDEDDTSQFSNFANEVGIRGAIGLVAAVDFTGEARRRIEKMGLIAASCDDLLRIVRLWDPMKQRSAVTAFIYYVEQIEKSSALATRVTAFLDGVRAPFIPRTGQTN